MNRRQATRPDRDPHGTTQDPRPETVREREVIVTDGGRRSGGGIAAILAAVVVAIVILAVVWMAGVFDESSTPSVEIPDEIDVNVDAPAESG